VGGAQGDGEEQADQHGGRMPGASCRIVLLVGIPTEGYRGSGSDPAPARAFEERVRIAGALGIIGYAFAEGTPRPR
jgi:hypothetical protein